MDKIQKYKKIREDLLNNDELGDAGNSLAEMVSKLIRSEELFERFYDYFDHGYYLGYFLIQSQRIEGLVASIAADAETLKALRSGTEPKQLKREKPLGILVQLMKNYIESEHVFKKLNDFKDFRNKIVHRMAGDFSVDLAQIENSIKEKYSPDSVFELQHFLSEILKEIGSETFRIKAGASEAEKFISLWDKNFREKVGVSGVEFKII